jgi:hypothetical protein
MGVQNGSNFFIIKDSSFFVSCTLCDLLADIFMETVTCDTVPLNIHRLEHRLFPPRQSSTKILRKEEVLLLHVFFYILLKRPVLYRK